MKVRLTGDLIYYNAATSQSFLSVAAYNKWSRTNPLVDETYLFAGYRLWL